MKKVPLFVLDAIIFTIIVAVIPAATDWLIRDDVWLQLRDPWTGGAWLNAPIFGIVFALLYDSPLRRWFAKKT